MASYEHDEGEMINKAKLANMTTIQRGYDNNNDDDEDTTMTMTINIIISTICDEYTTTTRMRCDTTTRIRCDSTTRIRPATSTRI